VSRPDKLSIKSGDGLKSDQIQKRKSPLYLSRTVCDFFNHNGLEIAKAGLVALAEFFTCPASRLVNRHELDFTTESTKKSKEIFALPTKIETALKLESEP